MLQKCLSRIVLVAIVAAVAAAISSGAEPAHAQIRGASTVHSETGRPFMTTYGPTDFSAHPQSWDIVQDDRGVIFIGNGLGVLEFDGASWRLASTDNKSVVRSLALDDSGRMYAGSSNDFGYLIPDSLGQLRYISLLPLVSGDQLNFNDVWTTIATPDGVYFQARERIFRFTPIETGADLEWKVKTWEPVERTFYAWFVDGVYYVHDSGAGLMRMVDDVLEVVPGGEQFAGERMQVFIPFEDNDVRKYLVGQFNSGLQVFDGESFQPFASEANELLRTEGLYKGVALSNGTFALGTLNEGVVVIDRTGQILLHVNAESGLPSNSVLDLFVDRQGTLWVATEGGLSVLETPSPLSRYTADNGINGTIAHITRHAGLLYATTSQGVFKLNPDDQRFEKFSGMVAGSSQSWWFLETHGQLLVSTSTGIYEIAGNKLRMIRPNTNDSFNPTRIHASLADPDVIWVGLRDGLAGLRWNNGTWTDLGKIPGISAAVTHIEERKPGELWLGMISQGLARVSVDARDIESAIVEEFGAANGLPPGGFSVHTIAGELVLSSKDGIYRYLDDENRFEPDSGFAAVGFSGSQEEYSFEEDFLGNVWINFGLETALMRKRVDGSYVKEQTPLLRFADVSVFDIYAENDGVVWFGGDQLVVRFDPRVPKNYASDYSAMIRSISAKGQLLYAGMGDVPPPRINPELNAVRLTFAAPTYEAPEATRYSTLLEGFEEEWTEWSPESRRDFTNLPASNYTFRVKASNIYGHESAEASYDLTVLPRWYETWWAWLLFAAGFGLIVFGLVRAQTNKLMAERAVLEDQVRQRATELEAQKEYVAKADANIELLSRVGRDITATLSTRAIIDKAYENVNALMDAAVFGIGLYNEETDTIDFPASKEKGETLPPFSYDLVDPNRLAVWCFVNEKPVFINDYSREYTQYVRENPDPLAGDAPESVIYLPLIHKEEVVGAITVQSFQKHAYTESHLNILNNIGIYTAIALDDADTHQKLNESLESLRVSQEQLLNQEKMASLGALTSGIAQELKNPLNFITNFAELNEELADELLTELTSNKDRPIAEILEDLDDLLSSLKTNSVQINHHGRRADTIVRSMMLHASGAMGERQIIDLNELVDQYVTFSYHGMRAQVPDFNVTIERQFAEGPLKVELVPQDISHVLLNLLSNAFYAVNREKQRRAESGESGYVPEVILQTRTGMRGVEVTVQDNGPGMPREVRDRVFEPFFTTKPTGSGTGLGLSLSYEIVTKGHGGTLSVSSDEGKGASFTLTLPV